MHTTTLKPSLPPLPHFEALSTYEAVEYDRPEVMDLLKAMDKDSGEVAQIAVFIPITRPAMEYSTF